MVKEYLLQAVKAIEGERDRQVAVIKDRITRDKIAPYNADIDQKRAKALSELDTELNEKIVELKNYYENKKQELIRLGEENKAVNADNVYAAELSVFTVEYDKAIAKLNAQIAEIKE